MKTYSTGKACGAALLGIALSIGGAQARPADDRGEGLTISGSVRAKAEVIDGQFRPKAPTDDAMLSFRTLILARYDFGGVHLVGEIDDARAYFQRQGSSAGISDVNALEPIQAYLGVDLGAIAGQGGKGVFRAGRFTFESGSNRLVERSDSSNTPVTFLGAQFDWSSKRGDRVNLFWTRPFDRFPSAAAGISDNAVELDRTSPGLTYKGASLTRAGLVAGASGEVFGMWLDEHDRPGRATRDRHLFTFGARLFRKPGKAKVDFDLEAALQHGSTRTSTSASDITDRRVRAGMSHLEFGYTFASGWSPRLAALFDYASGDTPQAGYRRFDPLFGSRRGDFGPTGLYGPISRANIVSPGIAVEGKPDKATDFAVKARLFWLASATDSFGATGVKDASGASGRDGAAQIEARVRRWIVASTLRLEVGAAWLGKGRFLTDAPNAPATGDTRHAYLALTTQF